VGIQRLNQEAAKAFYAGVHAGVSVDENEALRWITANPAWALGIQDEVGTLEPGKRADLVLWDGHPFSNYTSASQVYIDGALVFDTENPGEHWSDFVTGQGVAP
jgi:imidazolonepropionase-like amidohydrolase